MNDDKNIKKSETKDSTKIMKKSINENWIAHKPLWISLIVVLVLAIVVGVSASLINSKSFVQKMFTSMIPQKVEDIDFDGNKMTFYREKNPKYDKSISVDDENYEPEFIFYYKDENGEKVYLENGMYNFVDANGEEQSAPITLYFAAMLMPKVQKLKTALQITGWSLLAVAVVVGIVVWYIKDKQYYENQKKAVVHKKK